MKNKTSKTIVLLVFVCICLLSTPIATVISNCINITTTEIELCRITNYSWSIRIACVMLFMYFAFGRKGNE